VERVHTILYLSTYSTFTVPVFLMIETFLVVVFCEKSVLFIKDFRESAYTVYIWYLKYI